MSDCVLDGTGTIRLSIFDVVVCFMVMVMVMVMLLLAFLLSVVLKISFVTKICLTHMHD
jgi:hypothetical protein